MIRATFIGFVANLIHSGLNLMKKTYSYTYDLCLRVFLLAFFATVSVHANEINKDDGLCQAPSAAYEINIPEISSSLQNIQDLEGVNERGLLRVLLHRKTNACTIQYEACRALK